MARTLKVIGKNSILETYTIVEGQQLVIDAQQEVNYQLIDNITGFAPQNIIAKRVGDDLVIIFNKTEAGRSGRFDDIKEDIIIKDYYQEGELETIGLVIGEYENGKYYAYIPESGETQDAITILDKGIARPQALGGEDIFPLWTFNPFWLSLLPAFVFATLQEDSSVPNVTVLGKPTLTIGEAQDGVNAKEISDGVQTVVGLPTGTKAGDTVNVIVTKQLFIPLLLRKWVKVSRM